MDLARFDKDLWPRRARAGFHRGRAPWNTFRSRFERIFNDKAAATAPERLRAMRAKCTRYVHLLRTLSCLLHLRRSVFGHRRAAEPTDAGSALLRQEGIR